MKRKFLFLPTLKINSLRSFFTGIVFDIFYLFHPEMHPDVLTYILTPFFMPIFLFAWWIISLVFDFFNFGGIIRIIMILFSIFGDPFLYVLFKIKPEWNPVDEFNFLNFTGFIYVYEDRTPVISEDEFKISPQFITDNRTCNSCEYYVSKGEINPYNYECKKRHNPKNGYSIACYDYKERFTIGQTVNSCDNCLHLDYSGNCKHKFIVPKSKSACANFVER